MKKLIKMLIGSLVLCAILALKPIVTVRIGRIRAYRLGSFVGDLDRHLAYSRIARERKIELFFLDHDDVCNKFIEELWRREVWVLPRLFLEFPFQVISHTSRIQGRLNGHLWSSLDIDHWSPVLGDRDPHNLLDFAPPTFRLLKSEIGRGNRELLEIGVSPNRQIALIIGRDSIYGSSRGDSPGLHSHRNVSINDFEESIELLLQRGFVVFRMGSQVKENLRCADERTVFDYATNGMRSEFLDVYLPSVCTLCVSVATGLDAIPTLFRKPTLYANVVPIGMYPSYRSNALALGKSLIDKRSGRVLNLREIHERHLLFDFRTTAYLDADVEVVDNSPLVIRDAVSELISHVVEGNPWPPEDEFLWQRFCSEFKPLVDTYPIQIHGDLRARYSASGLREGHFRIYERL